MKHTPSHAPNLGLRCRSCQTNLEQHQVSRYSGRRPADPVARCINKACGMFERWVKW